MKLTRVNLYEVVVPVHPGRVHSACFGPAVFDVVPRLILEAHTDVGIVGYGETRGGTPLERVVRQIRLLRGVDLTRIRLQDPPVIDLSDDDIFAHQETGSHSGFWEFFPPDLDDLGIHTLLFDLAGKQAGRPMHDLMGGAYRMRVSTSAWMGRMTPEDSAHAAARARAGGYTGIKLKCSLEDDIVARAEAIREACGTEFKLTVDPNRRFYRPGDALETLRQLAKVGNVGCLEDPFFKENLSWYRTLRQMGLFPVALHWCNGLRLEEIVRADACDYVNLQGVPWQVRKAADACAAVGIPSWHASGADLGILEASYLHVCAATESMVRPSDVFGRSIRVHNLISDPFAPCDGHVAVPTGPGLGVEVDRDALEHYSRQRFSLSLDDPAAEPVALSGRHDRQTS
ncbi:MAG TPA: mandelate racemase/muconate lactonizing enzyme family protein [Chthoniobacteraceae bacterium]|nr:mandelate racemase/muconate lactonizing enzyme family protein [Chthoniobacteraceae bacterium]